MDALVTDAHIHSAVWGLRALGRRGLRVLALGPDRGAPGLWSRYAAARAVGPDSEVDPAGFAAAVARLAERQGPLVVYPSQEESIDALLAAELPPQARLPYPDRGSLAVVRQKPALAERAHAAGLATPTTVFLGEARELRGLRLPGPCIVKPVRKSALPIARLVRSDEEVREIAERVPDEEPLLVQLVAPGPLMALSLVLARDGRLAARFQQEARRTWPRQAGPSSLAVSVAPDERLAHAVGRVLAEAGFWGLVQIQFIRGEDGPVLIDANPRFYGSLPLALAAGVNLPATWHAVAVDGETPATPGPYRVGVSYRSLESDIMAALHGEPGLLLRRVPHPRTGAMWAADDRLAGALLGGRAAAAWLRRQAGRGVAVSRRAAGRRAA
jgi:predicted ATP-grasp superfamily ATP-dependent carboligase